MDDKETMLHRLCKEIAKSRKLTQGSLEICRHDGKFSILNNKGDYAGLDEQELLLCNSISEIVNLGLDDLIEIHCHKGEPQGVHVKRISRGRNYLLTVHDKSIKFKESK